MLPDDNVDEALTSLVKLDEERGLLKRDIAADRSPAARPGYRAARARKPAATTPDAGRRT